MSSNNWLAVLFLSFIIVPFSFSSLEFTFPLCSETHIKAEYAIQEPVPCKQHLHEHTKNAMLVYSILNITCLTSLPFLVNKSQLLQRQPFTFLELKHILQQQIILKYLRF